jgi:hypothetical protein
VRIVFFILLAANILFLAWAQWIDGPRDAGAHDALSHLPRLQLMGEKEAPKPTAATPPPAPPPPESLAPVVAEKVALQIPSLPQVARCTSVGPFNDIAHAARAAGLLTQRGFKLQQRAEEGETIEGYWVFVGGLSSEQDVNEVVAQLEKNGFTDAHVMNNFSTNRRISVGMFSTRERAEKRAAAIKAIGLSPEVGERKFPGTVYWVDVALASADDKPPEYLFADIGHTQVEMQPCPTALRPADPAVTAAKTAESARR